MTKPQAPRKMVNLPGPVHATAQKIKQEIEARAGVQVSLVSVLGRAVQCLHDAQAGGAWLSPKEAAGGYETRFRDRTIRIVEQLVRAIAPEKAVERVEFRDETLLVWLHGKSKPLAMRHAAGVASEQPTLN